MPARECLTIRNRIFNYAMLNDLKACADGLKMDGDVYKADPIFPSGQKSSDLLKWKKFANSLRLRLAVRICNADRSKATEVIDELMEDEQNLMTSNEDNCLLQWGDNADTRNYFYDYLVINREVIWISFTLPANRF